VRYQPSLLSNYYFTTFPPKDIRYQCFEGHCIASCADPHHLTHYRAALELVHWLILALSGSLYEKISQPSALHCGMSVPLGKFTLYETALFHAYLKIQVVYDANSHAAENTRGGYQVVHFFG